MKRNDLITLELTDLPLESLPKIFTFLENTLEEFLDLDVFEVKIKKFTILEQYFICKYGVEYYSKPKLTSWLNKQKEDHGMEDETVRRIQENSIEFLSSVEGMKNSLERIAKNHKRKYKNFKDLQFPYEEEIIDYRIPLYFVPQTIEDFESRHKTFSQNKKRFKAEVFEIFRDIFSDHDLEWFFNNSFDFQFNPYPISLLYIEVQDVGDFKSRVYTLYQSYIEFYKSEKVKYEKYFANYCEDLAKGIKNSEIKEKRADSRGLLIETGRTVEMSEERKKFYPKPEKLKELKKSFVLSEVGKIDFIKVLYNSFPFIREEYVEKKIKNDDYTLDKFLSTFSTSIRSTKSTPDN
ncbi:hypothetical protein [uncultured Chryseobacterium sp.]|uniref:hypothetical protein n=1 Tax=uncultured Chryseobacterium sp. TaxID=259322 RepID=UPI0025895E7C|nr:hypothetical protein [uncultured Chryseobacterium sp.]